MSTFDRAFNRVFTNEGEFQNDPADRGNWTSGKVGEGLLKGTKYGISAMTYPHLDIANLSLADAKEIYRRDWWERAGLGYLHFAIGYQVFDAAINHGMHQATRMMQRAAKVRDDGVIGPITKGAIRDTPLDDFILRFLGERLVFMTNVRTWDRYGKGWARRIAHNLLFASEDN